MDAGVLWRLEATWTGRADGERSQAWMERQQRKVIDGIASMAKGLGDKSFCSGIHLSLSDIAVGCALGWIDHRFPEIDWRTAHPRLVKLYDKLMLRASFSDTRP